MNLQNLIAIIIPSATVVYQTGVLSQVVKELKKIVADHELRLRRMEIPEKNQNRM